MLFILLEFRIECCDSFMNVLNLIFLIVYGRVIFGGIQKELFKKLICKQMASFWKMLLI